MIHIKSYTIPESHKKKYDNKDINIDKVNQDSLKCPLLDFNYYSTIIKNNVNIIINNCHKCIDDYLKQNRNVFNGKLKFSNLSIISEIKIYMGVKLIYTHDVIKFTIYLLNKLPEIMANNEIYFNHNSLIDKKECEFDLNILNNEGKLNRKLNLLLYDLYDNTFYDMIKHY